MPVVLSVTRHVFLKTDEKFEYYRSTIAEHCTLNPDLIDQPMKLRLVLVSLICTNKYYYRASYARDPEFTKFVYDWFNNMVTGYSKHGLDWFSSMVEFTHIVKLDMIPRYESRVERFDRTLETLRQNERRNLGLEHTQDHRFSPTPSQ